MDSKLLLIGGVGAAVVLALIAGLWALGTYNDLVAQSQGVDAQWAQVQVVYQRRADLIPNLVSSVKGYMKHESGLLESITALRSQWAAAQTPEDQVRVGSQMDSAFSRLIVVAENYPELKADASVARLMDELAGSENRISIERMRYNDAVRRYNLAVRSFPSSLLASWGGFKERPYFQAQAGAESAPAVDLG